MNRYKKMSCTEWVIQIKNFVNKTKLKMSLSKNLKKYFNSRPYTIIFEKIKEMSEIGFLLL